MRIMNKKTKEVFEVIGLHSATTWLYVLVGNIKTKELSVIPSSKILKDYELKGDEK